MKKLVLLLFVAALGFALIFYVQSEPHKVETQVVKVYFSNSLKDHGLLDCARVYPVERTIEATTTIGTVALRELLKGPTEAEKGVGHFTSLAPGTKLKSLRIENGSAYADFNEALDTGVAGSCRVTAIRAQIEETLKQFSTVTQVVISRNGETEDVLQP